MILAILQARVSSSRLPEKVLLPLVGEPMLARQLERILRSEKIDRLIVATSNDVSDDPIAQLCENKSISCFRGSLEDVLDRFYQAAKPFNPEHVVRLTGDCPLSDPDLIDAIICAHIAGKYDYTTNALEPTYPDGLDVEVMRYKCLEEAWRNADLLSEREHVTPYIHQRSSHFNINHFKSNENLSHLRWTVDERLDYELINHFYQALYPLKSTFTTVDVLTYLHENPELTIYNTDFQRNEGYIKSLKQDQVQL
ncbi:cytidylyltransferase domain-containing protein [Paenibacillus sp. LjRoot56]|uniref:cytidylyltransferase domain-containing protein n=1 Tax=Paenibacillus sp. LjRoot56 TaxID=3342333 RepID=UPI003ECD5686